MRLLVVNGPNPEIPDDLEEKLTVWGKGLGVTVEIRQSEDETLIADTLARFEGDGIVIGPAGLASTRVIADVIEQISLPVVEVHPGDVVESEIQDVTVRRIFGRGMASYRDGMRHLVNRAAVPFETVPYGPHPDNVGDLRGEGKKLIVLAHGGLWRQEYERDTTESLAVDLARRGYRTWNLEYRRLGDGGGWPGSGEDVLGALDSIHALGFGAGPVSLIGHSAGSYLLMWAAGRTRIDIDLHVALGPLLDLEAAVEFDDVGAEQCAVLLGGGAPRVSPGATPTVLVHGDADQIVPVQRSIDFSKRHSIDLRRSVRDHFSLLDPTRPEWDWVITRLASQ